MDKSFQHKKKLGLTAVGLYALALAIVVIRSFIQEKHRFFR